MASKTPSLSLYSLSWRCTQYIYRSFSTTARQLAVGPEHPRYIEVPEPPQQTIPYHPPVKGTLPVPRKVLARTSSDEALERQIADSTKRPAKEKTPLPGSREEWKLKMGEMRRQNLREGLMGLKARQVAKSRRLRIRSEQTRADRMERLLRPEREDERLTAPSNNLDLYALFKMLPPDPTRNQRIKRKSRNIEIAAVRKREERMDALHSLYMNARHFIVTPQQLEKAVDDAFGTPENPVRFGTPVGIRDSNLRGKSIWALGKPERIQDMLYRNDPFSSPRPTDSLGGATDINQDRIRRIAETLTGGKMDKPDGQ